MTVKTCYVTFARLPSNKLAPEVTAGEATSSPRELLKPRSLLSGGDKLSTITLTRMCPKGPTYPEECTAEQVQELQ